MYWGWTDLGYSYKKITSVGEADSVNSVSASACHIGGPKGVTPCYSYKQPDEIEL